MAEEIWRSLIRELNVTGGQESSCSGRDLEGLEHELGFKFPRGYKEFCDVFGSGELGGFIRVYCFCFRSEGQVIPNLRRLQGELGLIALNTELGWDMDRLKSGHPGPDPSKLTLLQKVLQPRYRA